MLRTRAMSKLFTMSLTLVLFAACAGAPSLLRKETLPEERIALLAGQVEELIANTRMEQPSAPDYNVDKRTGEVVGELEPLNVMVSLDEIRQKIPVLTNLHVDNEAMLSAIRGRVLRQPAVAELKQKGCVGENREGLLQCLGTEWCGPDRDLKNRAAYVVLAENHDRRRIFEQVVEANDLGSSAVERVREIFAGQIHMKAWAGTPLQSSDGTWKRK